MFSESFEYGAMQKCANFVDLEKCCKMDKIEYFHAEVGFDTAEDEPSKASYSGRALRLKNTIPGFLI